MVLLPAARPVRGSELFDGRYRPPGHPARSTCGRRRTMALPALRHAAGKIRKGPHRIRRPDLLRSSGCQSAGIGPRRTAEPAVRTHRKRGQHPFHAGHPSLAPQTAHFVAEDRRDLHGAPSGVALFERGDSAPLCFARAVRRQRRRDRCGPVALSGRQRSGAVVGRSRYARRAAERSFIR